MVSTNCMRKQSAAQRRPQNKTVQQSWARVAFSVAPGPAWGLQHTTANSGAAQAQLGQSSRLLSCAAQQDSSALGRPVENE
jgi:hypothetical protein